MVESAASEERQTVLRTLVAQQNGQLLEVLPPLLDDSAMRIAAIRAFGAIEDERAPELLLSRYGQWDPPAKRAAKTT